MIQLRVPIHDWRLFPGEDSILQGEVHRSVTLMGFAPGLYQARLAPQGREQGETRSTPWQTLEIRSQPNPPSPDSAGSGN